MDGQAHMLRWLARFLHGTGGGGAGGVVNPRVFEEVFVGSQLDTTGGIFVRACMQWGKTAFYYAKIVGHKDTAVRDRGRVKARRRQATVWR